MNKIIKLFFITCCIFYIINSSSASSGGSSSNGDDDVITLIVNPNNNNVYPIDGQCGNNITFTCNSIGDAVNYYNIIKTLQNPTPTQLIYQPLLILLAEGSYSVDNNSVNLFQFNVTISPLSSNDDHEVIFDGTKNTNGVPLFNVIPPAGLDDSNTKSKVTINGLIFQNFETTIFKLITNSSITNIEINGCDFNNYNGSITGQSMLVINENSQQKYRIISLTYIYLKDCYIGDSLLNQDTTLVNAKNTYVEFDDVHFDIVSNSSSVFTINQGYLVLSKCTFFNVTSSYGIFNTNDTIFSADETSFEDNHSLINGGILNYQSNIFDIFLFTFTSCSFINNTADVNGSIVHAFSQNKYNEKEVYLSFIKSSNFTGNTAKNSGGIVYSDNTPISIDNCNLGNNNATVLGGLFAIYNTELTLENLTISHQNLDIDEINSISTYNTQVNGSIIYSIDSRVQIFNVSLVEDFTNAFYCQDSFMSFQNSTNPSSVLTCLDCNVFFNEVNQCRSDSYSSLSSEDSSSHHNSHDSHDGSVANTLKIGSFISLLFFILVLI